MFVFSFASKDSGVVREWAAATKRPGVNLVRAVSARCAEEISDSIRPLVGTQHPVIASIHWGGNWGYAVPEEQVTFARRLIDAGCVDIIHGHSSHHVKGIEVYRGKLILYGCGDLINDYEGITGEEVYRDDLALMYFPTIHTTEGTLAGLEMVPSAHSEYAAQSRRTGRCGISGRYFEPGGQGLRYPRAARNGQRVEA